VLLETLGRHVRERGARPFLRHAGRTVSYAEFDALSNRAANALGARGVVKGDRVTLALGNSVEYVVAAIGVLKAGAILHPVNAALGASELSYVLGHADPRVVVTDAASDAKLAGLGRATVLGGALVDGASDARPAVTIVPGDLGTKGGLVTDEHARVLREDGSVIPGLYAAGNVSASVMGNTYPGPGGTIGPAIVFGYLAAEDLASHGG
jgi:acyl-coenzyme A synthetase/AMP-(fatty) acid ligase